MPLLPMSRQEAHDRGWDSLDFIFVSGDAYVDHPSFASALLGRLLEAKGYRVGLICQPDWKNIDCFKVLGRPRLAFLVSGGNMDSMVLHYTASKKPRREDYYSPGKRMGLRPDRATIVYSAALRQAYKNIAIIIGGIETSLRRLSHYDYWSDKVRRSILLDAKADLGVYGMGENALLELADLLHRGTPIETIRSVRGTFFRCTQDQMDAGTLPQPIILPPIEDLVAQPREYAHSFAVQYANTDPHSAKPLAERSGTDWVYINPPSWPLSRDQMDTVYSLPFERRAHPRYDADGGIAALEEVKFGLISTRGCFGACSFCALAFHQGRLIQSRSHDSLVSEALEVTKLSDFKGYIHDVGGPTANFRQNACPKMDQHGACTNKRCLAPKACSKLRVDHRDFLGLLRKIRAVPGVKKAFVRSGIRFDYLIADPDPSFFKELVEHHVSGQLKVAPEHCSDAVLQLMGKPGHEVYARFKREFEALNQACGKKQFLVPYFISGHPGSTLHDAIELACFLKASSYIPEQVQDFYPTPGTLSTAMYYSGYDPLSMQEVPVARGAREKAMQRALLQFHLPQNQDLVVQALQTAGRNDLIGRGKHCLVAPLSAQPWQRKAGTPVESKHWPSTKK